MQNLTKRFKKWSKKCHNEAKEGKMKFKMRNCNIRCKIESKDAKNEAKDTKMKQIYKTMKQNFCKWCRRSEKWSKALKIS